MQWFAPWVFFLRYLRNELLRRRGRTILTLLGLGLGVALVISIASLSAGLNRAQKKTLDPLGGIGTDLTVTLTPQQNQGGFQGGPGGGGGGGRDLIAANQSVITDLSKLGKPGTHFVHDFFLPGSQLTFQQSATKQVAALANVAQVTSGLTLLAEHQEGVVPKIVATLKTGGQTFQIQRNIPRPTAAQFAAMQACIDKLRAKNGSSSGGNGAAPGGFGGRGGVDRSAFAKCLPAGLQRFRTRFTTPQRTLRQVLNPPQTNITTASYTIGGVDQTQPTMGVVTTAQVTKGRFLAPAGGKEALVSATYAAKHRLKVGSKLDLNGTSFTIVGLVTPPLGGQSADVYLPLKQLQTLASQKGLANVILVRAISSSKVGAVEAAIKQALPQAQVASSKQVADKIRGSLVDASNLSHNLGLVLSIVAAAAAFLLAALLALSSVGKRVREIGTLKALGWTQRMVVRQIAGESVVQGAAGGVIGIVLGVVAALAISAFGPTLTASATTGGGGALLGVGTVRTATSAVSLTAPVGITILLLGFGLALMGGLIAGAAGALRAARLRPADALRQME
ncbi:MAG: putative transport system permease protein [Gaiellaceae bacterium]|nr:putative transport system permease protein [Gaiellaceae bacterium]